MRIAPVLLLLAFAAPLAGLVACEDKKPASESAKSDAGADKYATADPKLEKALKAATSASAAAATQGPPMTGIWVRR
jgi:hypothetical protein